MQPTIDALAFGTNGRSVTSMADHGDASETWTIHGTVDSCGYTVTLRAYDRTIVNSNTAITFSGAKAVGFAVF